ncbi:MAG: AAA family ATPase [Gammaproteobacteria bacterium]|nr:AAA family ATPase [Gammaproteobacteria bacterium]
MNAQDPSLIQALQNAALYDHPVADFRVIETHISWVLLTGPYAYKIKKAVDLGFLDFSTLEKRRFYCEEELRLNRRLAPALYRDVVTIIGAPTRPALNGAGAALEYAVRMVQFDPALQFDHLLAAGRLTPDLLARFAAGLARFHAAAAHTTADDAYGTPAAVFEPVEENFAQIRLPSGFPAEAAMLRELHDWSAQRRAPLRPALERRKANGHVRECHGDLHLANITLHEGEPLAFDCLEFSDRLRWIDVMSEIAFLVMDLDAHGRADLGLGFLNEYLHHTGDYAGLGMLHYYQAYRALVRAKVESIRLRQSGTTEPASCDALRAYIRLARDYIRPRPRALVITRGLSGSGKTTHTNALLAPCGMIRVRSDVERKRLFGYAPEARTQSGLDVDLYSADASSRTYRRLEELAVAIIDAGFTALIDATFLKEAQRERFRALAARSGVPFLILDFQADSAILRTRVEARTRGACDASEATPAVLERQLQTQESLTIEECAAALTVDSGQHVDNVALVAEINRRIIRQTGDG